jgi:hypothetical protein
LPVSSVVDPIFAWVVSWSSLFLSLDPLLWEKVRKGIRDLKDEIPSCFLPLSPSSILLMIDISLILASGRVLRRESGCSFSSKWRSQSQEMKFSSFPSFFLSWLFFLCFWKLDFYITRSKVTRQWWYVLEILPAIEYNCGL